MAKIVTMPLKLHLDDYGSAMASKSKEGHIDDTRIAVVKFGFETLKDITADKVNKYASELRKAGRAAAIERMRDTFTQPAELRKTGTADTQQLGREKVLSVATDCKNNQIDNKPPELSEHKKAQHFEVFFLQKAGFKVKRLRWELNPRWRICNPLP